jgi:hypothetical protein
VAIALDRDVEEVGYELGVGGISDTGSIVKKVKI